MHVEKYLCENIRVYKKQKVYAHIYFHIYV